MLFQAIILAASAAIASAQITYNGSEIICPADLPNGTFCAGDSLSTNIIIRCVNGKAGPGNCNDNLDGEPPVGDFSTTCWQTSNTSGDAACAKNCIVYCGSGGCAKDFTLPNCTPFYTATSSSSAPSSTTSSLTTSTATTTVTANSTTETLTTTTTYCPSSTGTPPPPPNNGTTGTTGTTGITSYTTSGSPTNKPTGPTSTSAAFTGAATAFQPMIGGALAGAGLVAAYFL